MMPWIPWIPTHHFSPCLMSIDVHSLSCLEFLSNMLLQSSRSFSLELQMALQNGQSVVQLGTANGTPKRPISVTKAEKRQLLYSLVCFSGSNKYMQKHQKPSQTLYSRTDQSLRPSRPRAHLNSVSSRKPGKDALST